MRKKDFQLIRCLYVHNILYILCAIIPTVTTVYSTIRMSQTQTPLEQVVVQFLTNIGALIFAIPYSTNFIIFVCISKSFRQELKQYATCLRSRSTNVTIIQPEETNQHEQQSYRNDTQLNTIS